MPTSYLCYMWVSFFTKSQKEVPTYSRIKKTALIEMKEEGIYRYGIPTNSSCFKVCSQKPTVLRFSLRP